MGASAQAAVATLGCAALRARPQIPSDKCVFNEKPDMKAAEITAAGIEALKSGKYKMVRINYANPDMVGHTGGWRAAPWVWVVCVWLCAVCGSRRGRGGRRVVEAACAS